MNKVVVISLVVFSLLSCITQITTRSVNQPVVSSIETKKFCDAVSFVLVDNGFDIKMLNESYGLINTEWRPVSSGADTVSTLFSALGEGPMTTYSRAMMIQVRLDEAGYKLTPKIKRMAHTTTLFGGSARETVHYPGPKEAEGKLAEKLVQEINQKLNLPNNYIWQEKVLAVGPEPGK